MEKNDFIKGAIIGGVLGGVAALLLAPKSGKELCDDICDGCDCVNHKSHDFVESIKDRGHKLLNTFNGHVEEEESHSGLISGGALGSIIGIVAALLLAPKSGNKLREQLGDKYDDIHDKAEYAIKSLNKKSHDVGDKIDEWKDVLGTLVNKLSSTSKKGAKAASFGSDDIVEWASLGLKLYDKFHKRG